MKKLMTLLLTLVSIYSIAEIKIESNTALSGTKKEVSEGAAKRVAVFYKWYMTYLAKNEAAPVQHAVYDQNITAQLQSRIFLSRSDKADIFFAQKDIDLNSDLVLKPIDYADDKIYILMTVAGKYNYTLKIEMIMQKENWCINNVYRS